MAQDRRIFLQCLSAFCLESAITPGVFSEMLGQETKEEQQLEIKIRGLWKLQSYTYTSNKKSFTSPKEIEAIANFAENRYDVNFATYISRMGIKRTRRASESGTYSVMDSRIRLFAEKASDDDEKGEEFLTDVSIDGDAMKLSSNNGANHEVWKKVSGLFFG